MKCWTAGLQDYMDDVQQVLNNIGQHIFETYVLLPQDAQSVTFMPSTEHSSCVGRNCRQQQQQQ